MDRVKLVREENNGFCSWQY